MRIVHISSVHPPGDPRICYKECRSVARAGHEVHLVMAGAESLILEGVTIHSVARPRSRFDRVLRTVPGVLSVAKKLNPDWVHLHDPELMVGIPYLRAAGIRVVYDMHEDLPAQLRQKHWIPAVVRPLAAGIARTVERLLLPRCSVVYAEKSYGESRPWVTDSVEVLNFPILEDVRNIVAQARPAGLPWIGYIGSITRERGAFVMLQAAAELRRRGVEVGCLLIGGGPPRTMADLRDMAEKLELRHVEFPGYLAPADGLGMIAGCEVGAALLQPLPNYMDSYPTKLFEYMALGIPSVVSDFPLYRSIVERSGSGALVDPTDPVSVADAIASLLADPRISAEMGAAGRAAALESYSWESQVPQLLSLYVALGR
ncbi:glycosyltransferase [bacterium]|nr:glycosyltransferase [bacterium]